MRKNAINSIFAVIILIIVALPMIAEKTIAATQRQGIVDYSGVTDKDDIESIIIQYHKDMNKFLNSKMDLLLQNDVSDNNREAREAIPEKLNGIRNLSACPENYVSTWCVSMAMLDEYFVLREKLFALRDKALIKGAADGARKPQKNIEAKVLHELNVAQQTLELAAAAYNELRIAWAMHVKYLTLIDELEDYRNAIAAIRDEVEIFPFTFFNVQTAQCT